MIFHAQCVIWFLLVVSCSEVEIKVHRMFCCSSYRCSNSFVLIWCCEYDFILSILTCSKFHLECSPSDERIATPNLHICSQNCGPPFWPQTNFYKRGESLLFSCDQIRFEFESTDFNSATLRAINASVSIPKTTFQKRKSQTEKR